MKLREQGNVTKPSIDNVTDNISMYLANVYKNLCKSDDDQDNLRVVKESIKADISTSLRRTDLITNKVLTRGSSEPILWI